MVCVQADRKKRPNSHEPSLGFDISIVANLVLSGRGESIGRFGGLLGLRSRRLSARYLCRVRRERYGSRRASLSKRFRALRMVRVIFDGEHFESAANSSHVSGSNQY